MRLGLVGAGRPFSEMTVGVVTDLFLLQFLYLCLQILPQYLDHVHLSVLKFSLPLLLLLELVLRMIGKSHLISFQLFIWLQNLSDSA